MRDPILISTSISQAMGISMDAIGRYIAAYFVAIAIANAQTDISAAASPAPSPGSPRQDERYEETLLGHLRPALLAAKKACRLYYVVTCKDPDHDFPVPFPDVRTQAPLNDRPGLEAVREIFKYDERVRVSEDRNGMIKVRVGDVPPAILQAKIPLLKLSPLQQYNPISAVYALTEAKPVQAAMRKLGLKEAASVFSIATNLPAKPAPHLPAVIKDVSLDQLLDRVARTFGVIVIFGQCTDSTGAGFIRIDTVDLQAE
jgi:hypothetical protein